MKTRTRKPGFKKRLIPAIAVLLIGAMGSYLLFASHADSFITLYELYYPGGGANAIYHTTDAASSQDEITNHGWKLKGSYKYVNEVGSNPIPVYRGHEYGTRNNFYTTNKANIPSSYAYIGIAFYEASSPTVPYGYIRNTTSGYKLDYPCSCNPAPVVTPPPPPPSGGGTNPTPAPKTTPKTTPKVVVTGAGAAPAAPPTNAADAAVSAGTLGANLKMPADNASAIHIAYGTSDDVLINSTQDTAVSGNDVTIPLTSLSAKTTYSYQIVRNNGGGTVSSPTAHFTTKGYTIAITFQDANGNPLSGISGSIADSKQSATSDKDGKLTFENLDGGSYTITFSYKDHQHTLDYNTDSITDAGAPDKVAVLADSVDVSQFSSGDASTQQTAGKHSSGKIILGALVILLLIGGGLWYFIWRGRKSYDPLADYSAIPLPQSQPSVIQSPTNASNPSPGPTPSTLSSGHESLREMVIKSMHEQAQAKKNQNPPEPPKL